MREVIAEYTAEDVYSTKRGEIQTKIRERAETMLGEKMMVGSEGGDSEDLDNAPYRIPLYAMINLINTMAWPYGTLQIAGAAQMPLYYPRSRLFSLRLNAPTAAASAACGSGASRRDSRRLMRRREACPII
jgi:hypothetical protein